MPSLSPVHENSFPLLNDINEQMYDDQIILNNQWGGTGIANMNPTYTTLQPMSRASHQALDHMNSINLNQNRSSPKCLSSNMNLLKHHEMNLHIKHPKYWEAADIVTWLFQLAAKHDINYQNLHMENFNNVTGYDLINMNCNDFIARDQRYGELIYNEFQSVLHSDVSRHFEVKLEPDISHYPNCTYEENSSTANNLSIAPDLTAYFSSEKISVHELDIYLNGAPNNGDPNNKSVSLMPQSRKIFTSWIKPEHESDHESDKSYENLHSRQDSECSYSSGSPTPPPIKRGPGRPPNKERQQRHRNKHGSKGNHLWEFIRDILKNPKFHPKVIKWENKDEGVFRFVESETVAKMWGDKKSNPRMTYEKLSRAMRYYYKSQILLPVIGRRLVYKFGPKATGWRD